LATARRNNLDGPRSGATQADLYATLLRGSGPLVAPQLVAAVAGSTAIKPVHAHETQDIERFAEVPGGMRR